MAYLTSIKLTYFCNAMQERTFSIHTLGCKLNFSESSDIARKLHEAGFSTSDQPEYILINSCAVTAAAEKKGRNLCSKLHREHPEAKIIVLGCYAALQSAQIRQWPGVVTTFGNPDKMSVIAYLLGDALPSTPPPFYSAYSSHDRTRSFLKIQDGCDYHCTYCTVCKARGESRSDTIDNVLKQINKIVAEGTQEINITGVNLGDFGRKNGSSFYQLVQAIDEQAFPARFRISSIEPNLLTEEIITRVAQSPCFMPHFHIPLQSGCNRILALMHRRYTRELFAEKIHSIKQQIPHACIALDVITGFPDESESDFQSSYNFLEALPISYLHVFTYSKRPGTVAATMKNQVPVQEKRARTAQLIALSQQKKQHFYAEHYNETRPVLWESDKKAEWMFGFTDNYIKVKSRYNATQCNLITPTLITPDNAVLEDE